MTHAATPPLPARDPALMSHREILRELAALLATAFWRTRRIPLAGSPLAEPSCDRPRAPGAARARRGHAKPKERNP